MKLEKQLKNQLDRIHRNKTLFLTYQNKLLDGAPTYDSLLEYILSAERLAVAARSLPEIGGGMQDKDVMLRKVLPPAHDATASLLPEGWVYLTLDALLPSKGQKVPKEFILYPVSYALERFQEKTLYQTMYSRTAIVVRHVYAENKPMGLIRDHDNIETKTLIDAITAHLLPNDNGLACCTLFLSKFGLRDMTEAFVLPYCDLSAWLDFYG